MTVSGLGRKHPEATIHGIRLKVRGGSRPPPAPLIGAYVTAFSIADDVQAAVVAGVRAVQAMGYDVEGVLPEGLSLPLSGWGAHVATGWPDFREEFPGQQEIEERLQDGGIVFSPFAGFDRV